jgi:hypothetical protein
LKTKSKELREPDLDGESSTRNTTVEFAATVNFLPASSFLTTKISACFRQSITRDGIHTLHPTISAHMMVPSDSEVFNCIKEGDFDSFLKLLRNGKASQRNCDQCGRSLLNVRVGHISHSLQDRSIFQSGTAILHFIQKHFQARKFLTRFEKSCSPRAVNHPVLVNNLKWRLGWDHK